MKNDDFFITGTADMFEREYNTWFNTAYKASIKTMRTTEIAEMRKMLMPAFIGGLHIGLEGSVKEELKVPVINKLKSRAK